MAQNLCPSCNAELKVDFRFCPNCGHDLQKPPVCPNCEYPNVSNLKFCPQCGSSLHGKPASKTKTKSKPTEMKTAVIEIEPPPNNGITIEFPHTSSQTFDFAVECAKKFPTFDQYGEGKKAIYRVTFDPSEMASVIELLENLKGWRRRTVFVDGQKVTWESVFSFAYCYIKKGASFKPELYCFGYENEYQFNIWGCFQTKLSFIENAPWFCWGRWLNDKGDWQFDKERISHELQKNLYPYRFCPALQLGLVEEALKVLPTVVNPTKDKNWKFIERWSDDGSPGLAITVKRFGYEDSVVMKGVCPNGQGALQEMAKKLRFRLPS